MRSKSKQEFKRYLYLLLTHVNNATIARKFILLTYEFAERKRVDRSTRENDAT